MTSPPWPPLPPSGPPSGLNFSRCTDATPLPPLPAATCRRTWSTNVVTTASSGCCQSVEGGPEIRPALDDVCGPDLLGERRNDVDDPAAPAGPELDGPRAEREQGVVTAAADVQPRVEVGAPLAHDDLAGVHLLAAEALDAEALRVGVAPVAGGRRALLVSHLVLPFYFLLPVSMPVTLTWVCFWRCPDLRR